MIKKCQKSQNLHRCQSRWWKQLNPPAHSDPPRPSYNFPHRCRTSCKTLNRSSVVRSERRTESNGRQQRKGSRRNMSRENRRDAWKIELLEKMNNSLQSVYRVQQKQWSLALNKKSSVFFSVNFFTNLYIGTYIIYKYIYKIKKIATASVRPPAAARRGRSICICAHYYT